jgi:hypothetical protein
MHHRFVARGHELLLINEWLSAEAAVGFWFEPMATELLREADMSPLADQGAYYRSITDPGEF